MTPRVRLEIAAACRATGMTWVAVAASLNLSERYLRKFVAARPDEWAAALRAAEDRLLEDVYAEALATMRERLRSDDERVSQAAAHSLLHHVAVIRAARERERAAAAQCQDTAVGITQEEADAIIAQLVAEAQEADIPILGPAAPVAPNDRCQK
ncbi:MAG: hypothetical protein AMXMBFR83_25200 [Phycisphaerae bacterium]